MSPTNAQAPRLNTAAAVEHLRHRGLKLSERQLRRLRAQHSGPAFTRGPRGGCSYAVADLDAYAAAERGVSVAELDRPAIPGLKTSAELIDFATAAALIERRLDGLDVPRARRTFERKLSRGLGERLGFKTGGAWRFERGRVNALVDRLAAVAEDARSWGEDPWERCA
jgi:hypothetical protein